MSGSVSVTEWLLDSDPAIRWQVLRDLTDERCAEAIEHFDMAPGAGQPSRWITLRALRLLRWADHSSA